MTIPGQMNDTVNLPDAPAIEGLRFRHFLGDSDYPGILEVNTGSKLADELGHDLFGSLDDIIRVYSHATNHDPHKDVLMAEVDGKMIAYTRLFWEAEPDGTRIYFHYGFMLPEWRGKGIGSAMLREGERRAREIDSERGAGERAELGAAWLN